jgi:hypothetical protein
VHQETKSIHQSKITKKNLANLLPINFNGSTKLPKTNVIPRPGANSQMISGYPSHLRSFAPAQGPTEESI